MLKINDTKQLPEGIFTINFKIIDQYKWKDPILKDEYKTGTYKIDNFYEGINIKLNHITCKDKTFFL